MFYNCYQQLKLTQSMVAFTTDFNGTLPYLPSIANIDNIQGRLLLSKLMIATATLEI